MDNLSTEDKAFQLTFETMFKTIQKGYPVSKMIIPESKDAELSPQASLTQIALDPHDDLSRVVYAFLHFHKVHNHLKNYLLKVRKMKSGYHKDFLDLLNDIFIDNYLIFREIAKFIHPEQYHYMNIWFDGFFINAFNELVLSSEKKYSRIQPQLFFLILLFLTLPRITRQIKEIPFAAVINFSPNMQKAWQKSLNQLDLIDFHNPLSKDSIQAFSLFIFNFFDMPVEITRHNLIEFDDIAKNNAVHFIKGLINRTDELIENINRVREEMATKPLSTDQ